MSPSPDPAQNHAPGSRAGGRNVWLDSSARSIFLGEGAVASRMAAVGRLKRVPGKPTRAQGNRTMLGRISSISIETAFGSPPRRSILLIELKAHRFDSIRARACFLSPGGSAARFAPSARTFRLNEARPRVGPRIFPVSGIRRRPPHCPPRRPPDDPRTTRRTHLRVGPHGDRGSNHPQAFESLVALRWSLHQGCYRGIRRLLAIVYVRATASGLASRPGCPCSYWMKHRGGPAT